jgi:membrane protease subunit HflK
MPWQNNSGSGGPWGGGGDGGGSRNPWGGGGGGRPPGGGGRPTPDFDEFIRRSQERLRASLPGGSTGQGRPRWIYVLVALAAVWLVFTSAYRVGPQERGVVLRLGSYVHTTGPGFHFKLPWPIDRVIKPKVEQVNVVEIGSAAGGSSENLMLTSDQNIIDIAYSVRWKIDQPENFLFQLADPETTIREVAESSMRAAIARATLDDAIGPQRAEIAEEVRARTEELLDSYGAGVDVLGVDIRQADPPAAVDEAFKDVSTAQQEAQQYLNNSRAYAQELIARAQGETALFDAVYEQYRLSPEVTRKRLYYETMEDILAKVDKTVVDADGVVPYLPLPPSATLPRQQPQQSQPQGQPQSQAGQR